MKEIVWNDRFNLGVEVIDKAHQKLFSIVNKLILMNEDSKKQPHACKEGVKYFKSYTLKHFAEEEEYMRRIAYKGYDKHKYIHDKMRDKTLPALEQELEEEHYSEESVQHFMGICIGWLNAHIIVEDRAIVNKAPVKWVYDAAEDELSAFEKAVIQTLQEMFRTEAEVARAHYGGGNFYAGNKICYRLRYRSVRDTFLQIFFVYEDRYVERMLSELLGRPLEKIDKTALYAVKVLSEKLIDNVKTYFPLTDGYHREKTEIIGFDQFVRTFSIDDPVYSVLFQTEEYGQFALCVRL